MKIPNQSAPVLRMNRSNLGKISVVGINPQQAGISDFADEVEEEEIQRISPRNRRRVLRYLNCRFGLQGGSREQCRQ